MPSSVLGRTMTLLGAFRPGDTELTLAELGRRTGIPKGTAHLLGNPHVGLMFVLPGRGEILRVEGHAVITVDDAVLDLSADGDRRPVAAIGVTVESVFVHCPASLRRAGLWDPESWGRVEAPSTEEVVKGHLAITAP